MTKSVRYRSVSITNYGMGRMSRINDAFIYVGYADGTRESKTVSYLEGLKEMAKLAKLSGRAPKFSINYFNPSISYRELEVWFR